MKVFGVVFPPSARSFELSILADRISCAVGADTSGLVDCLRFSQRQRTPDAGRCGVPSFDFSLLNAGRTRMSVKIVVSVTELTNMDAKDRYIVEGIALSTATEDVGDGPQGHENDTDPPSDGVYMICGVLIAMVLVGVLIVLLAVTISKLRKREEHHSSTVHPETTVVQTATSPTTIAMSSPTHPGDCCTQTSTTTVSTDIGSNNICEEQHIYAVTTTPSANPVESFTWQFPPPYPPRHMLPTQYALYNDQDTLVHGLPSDRPGFAKGFRKNLGGRWRRLVKRKAESDTCAIPPELKDQLKSIYVY